MHERLLTRPLLSVGRRPSWHAERMPHLATSASLLANHRIVVAQRADAWWRPPWLLLLLLVDVALVLIVVSVVVAVLHPSLAFIVLARHGLLGGRLRERRLGA